MWYVELALQESIVSHLCSTKELNCRLGFDHYLIGLYLFIYLLPMGNWSLLGVNRTALTGFLCSYFLKLLKGKPPPVKYHLAEDQKAVCMPLSDIATSQPLPREQTDKNRSLC